MRKNQKGFTLIELVVATGIFIIVVTLATSIFVLNNKTQTKTQRTQKIQNDMSIVFEKIVRDIKFNSLDYSFFSGNNPTNPTNSIQLIDSQDSLIRYELSDIGCVSEKSSPCLRMGADLNKDGKITSSEMTTLTSNSVKVINLDFYIIPMSDPFVAEGGVFLKNEQPTLTIVFSAQDVSDINFENLTLQTTVVSRVYER